MTPVSTKLPALSIANAGVRNSAAQREQVEGALSAKNTKGTASADASRQQLSAEQQHAIQQLQQVDRTVRAHEQAHLSAGRGVVTSGARFEYTYVPDGKQYAVGGEVSIDTSSERKPQANIDKGRLVQAAALAPKNPSPQDYRVAAKGGQLVSQGQDDLVREQQTQRNLDAQKAEAGREAARKQFEDSAPAAPLGIEAAPTSTPTSAPTGSRSTSDDNAFRLDAPVSIPSPDTSSNPPVVNLAMAAAAPGNGINDAMRQRLANTYNAGAYAAASAFSVFA